ncbi:hypothetical protein G3580_02770 [Nitrogeniibacter mangrovi]|uniref:Uncharacterized protein n=1 Tax=Nitrogeniibacter mangrovi TaxID=2016596 RepID=A0A6C1AZ71_9RHOO|nr:hypothetical protein [Nitrogeniibacter mangrovi]QID16646.1 hypothetical protein G3580_02770 [Nitrogeniibacter mangrovi]
MKPHPFILRCAVGVMAGALAAMAGAAGTGHDYPTVSRVEYVVDCMRDAPKASREYLYKCSCVIDQIAQRLSYDEFVNESTVANALTIGGERGEVMRDLRGGRQVARQFHGVENEARKACFMPPRG